MDNKEVDNILDKTFRNKINESATANGSIADWDVFSKKLSQSEGFENIKFDAGIKSKIAEFTIPYNNTHWELLKQRLIKEEYLKRKIFIYSIVESAAVVVLLFLFQQYDHGVNMQLNLDGSKDFASKSKNLESKISATDLSAIYSHQAFEYEPKNIVPNNLVKIASEELIDIESQVIIENNSEGLPPKKEIQLYSVEALQQNITELSSIKLNSTSPSLIEEKPVVVNDLYTAANNTTKEVVPNEKISEVQAVNKRSVKEVPSLKIQSFDISSVVMPSSIKYKETDAMRYIIPVLGFGQGVIKSSYDKIYNLKAYTTYSSQITSGALYAYKKRSLELLTGLRYTKKEYNPQRITELYYDQSNSPYKVSLEKIKYDILEIPLQFKTYFKQSPVINFYAKFGSSLNLTLASKYDVNEKDLSLSNFSAKSIATTSDGEIISNNAKLSKKEFNPGLFQSGGKLKENAFLTLTGEIGLERRINMSNHIIIGTEYARYFMIEGFGPNNDKFNVINFNIGLKHEIH